MTGSYFV